MKCSGSIDRKSLLYKTGVEYGDYTVNHVQGCFHGCLYPCYAMMMAKRFGTVKNYDEWIKPKVVDNAIELLEKELPKLKNKIKSVQLCFTTDPFMYQYEDIKELSISILKLINSYNILCTALTKGVLPKELVNLSKENSYGITLISLNESFRETMEPGASPYTLSNSKFYRPKFGLVDYIIIEKYQSTKIIRSFIIIMANKVIKFCSINNIEYHIKNKTITP